MKRGYVPLDRALSKLGLASRSEARALIAAGRITVNGRPAASPAQPVVPERAGIAIDGRAAEPRAERTTIMLHKPAGVVTTRRDPQGRPTVGDLVSDAGAAVIPVGRLDLATTGLLLMTNDTRLADWLTDPRTAIPRVYLVTVRGRVAPGACDRLVGGIELQGERLAAASAVLRKASGRESLLIVTLIEGRNREIRRLMTAVGHEVTRLRRVRFGGLDIGTLAPGRWRRVDEEELTAAFPGLPPPRGRPAPRGDAFFSKNERRRTKPP